MVGDVEDERRHERFCKGGKRAMYFGGWKNERVISEPVSSSSVSTEGRIVEVRRGDSSTHMAKVEGYLRVVNEDLGFASDLGDEFSRAFLFVKEKEVRGLLTIESISPSTHTYPSPLPSMVGVKQMWVSEGERRRGVCSRLVEGMRRSVSFPIKLPTNQLAFSQLTSDGYSFTKSLSSSTIIQYSPLPSSSLNTTIINQDHDEKQEEEEEG